MLAAAGDRDLRGFVSKAVVALEFVDDGLLELGDARCGGVFGEAVIERLFGGVLDVIRGVKIRLAGAETDHVLAAFLHLAGDGGDGEGDGRRE